MLYYKVVPTADQQKRLDGSILVAGELYTSGEVKRYNINRAFLIPVDISKRKIHWFFGARFQNEGV